ncbi:MAG: DUF2341 domain-containing protein [Planctomycetota bacterium]
MMNRVSHYFKILVFLLACWAYVGMAEDAPYSSWAHSGKLFILTTPDGANLPSTMSESGFPLLVRLDKDNFDFKQAKTDGSDIRFADASGAPLAYQIDAWNALDGSASVWVRIPEIKGNAQQEIRMFWGKADAVGESNGKAVFNTVNNYLTVYHLDDPTADSTGALTSKDHGTERVPGMIGTARHFIPGKGILCGDAIPTFPTGANPHSTEFWFKAERMGERIVCWGNGAPKAMVQIIVGKPPYLVADCYHGPANVRGKSLVPLNEWVHVFHTYDHGDSRLYVNGELDGVMTSNNAPMEFKAPVKMYMGGWQNYGFTGDIEEVRVSNAARSAHWIHMQYENQKPLQTLVGPLVRPGNDFSLSEKVINTAEGKNVTIALNAGGARKIYWIIKRDGHETPVAVDRFAFTLDAGRVTADETFTLLCKAVFEKETKTIDVPVTIKKGIPDPEFALKAPAVWDGRATIVVEAHVANVPAMQAKNASALTYHWTTSGMAVIKEITPSKLILKRANNSGALTITVAVSNGGKAVSQSITLAVKEPANDPWIARVPEKDEKPVDNQFFARDDKNEGTLYYNGTLEDSADSVFLKLYADDKLIRTENQNPNADKSYALSTKLTAGLIRYKIEFGTKAGGVEKVLRSVDNLICGDAYIIEGQSNAVGYNYENTRLREDLTHTDSPWIRSFGGNGEVDGEATRGGWGNARVERLTPTSPDRIHFISAWGMALAKKLVDEHKIPICILNGAVGGTRIDEHMPNHIRNAANPHRVRSIYARLKQRVVAAKLTHGIRGVLWHQGEADQGLDGPDNCYGCEMYWKYWEELTAAWKTDYPNIRNYYVYQIWPNACSQGGNTYSDKLRDVQRCFAHAYSNLSVMPTLHIPSGQNCHFKTDDYEKMGLLMVPLLERDSYGKKFDVPITAPDIQRAYYTSNKKDEIALAFDQPMLWDDALISQFFLDDNAPKIVAGSVAGNVITLKLAASCESKTVTYIVDRKWDRTHLLFGKNGIAALTFCDVPIDSMK